ncbi:hypothetical protein I317_07479 [Kwoniella heveanensis CBS 569]|nr:hypothetical protein I317_07479 [Kwoniella heveanensis CBS 569]
MASSMVPSSARMKMKKRVINLVNPADPQEFSYQSLSPETSLNDVSVDKHEEQLQASKDSVPTIQYIEAAQTLNYTPLNGVKGILRPSGTPGSGNGVRFFPKNRFRIITPNQSLFPPSPKPPTSPSNSFFSQLLSVTIPSMSPRKPEPEIEKPDESWEKPGEEGEVSLVASTASADHTTECMDEAQEESELRQDSWNGEPEIHCSPLALPHAAPDGHTSRDASFNGLELPSAEMQLPEDMSNLLSTDFTNADQPSYSMTTTTEQPSTTMIPPREIRCDLSPIREMGEISAEADFWGAPRPGEISTTITTMPAHTTNGDGSNQTIRQSLSPLVDTMSPAGQPSTPTPRSKPFNSSSIFADMSAEQAELTWPLARRVLDDETDSNFASPVRVGVTSSTLATPKATAAAGDVTEFFDCTTMTLSPPDSSVVIRASPNNDLVVPTQALFEAQAAHTSALVAELDIYRDLSKKLQSEVAERDGVLARLNIRALEAEVLHSQVHDLQKQLSTLKSAKQSESETPLSSSSSPPSRSSFAPSLSQKRGTLHDLPSDRTMAAQSEAKELEIRLAKAVSDTEGMAKQLRNARTSEDEIKAELTQVKKEISALEDRERDRLIQAEAKEDEVHTLQAQLEDAHQQLDLLEREQHDHGEERIQLLQEELDNAKRHITDLEANEDELHALRAEVESAHQQLDQLDSKDDELHAIRAELEDAHRLLDERDHVEEEMRILRGELEQTRQQLDEARSQSSAGPLQIELEKAKEKIAELKQHVADLTEVKLADEEEIENLLEEVDRYKGGRKREDDLKSRLTEIERRLEIESLRRQEVERALVQEKEAKQAAEGENGKLKRSLQTTREELVHSRTSAPQPPVSPSSSLKAEVAKLRSESASKDLEILNLQRRKAELKEDREMLNIALDSKQQELELMKRKFAVKGVAGATPLGTSRKANFDDNRTYATPLPASAAGPLKGPSTVTATASRRRSSLALLNHTPFPSVPKTLPPQTPAPRAQNLGTGAGYGRRHGVQLNPSTKMTSRVMRRVGEDKDEGQEHEEQDNENRPPPPDRVDSLRRRERLLA